MFVKRIAAAAALVLTGTIAANAADLTPAYNPPPAVAPAPYVPAPSFDWSGPYIGAYGGYVFGVGWIQTGVQAGYNFDLGGFVVGIEGQLGADWTLPGLIGEANANAKAGVVLGQALLYGEAGVGLLFPGPGFGWNAGGGLEFAVTNEMSLFVESKALGLFGGGLYGVSVQGGLNWHL